MYDSNGVRINLFFNHGKFSKTPAADVKKKAQTVSSDTKHLIIADLRYGKMCLFVYEGAKGKRKLIKAAPCSSAANIPGTKTTKTPAGSHKIGWKTDRLVYKNKEGKRWQYWSCSMTWQGWGIHSMTYHMSARYKYDRMYLLGGKLGAHNSPACIRTENWLADWIYKHCGRGTVIHVIR
jgi:lipoprotein-anchoring transpeptidase ErfK/SrfK